MCKYCLSSSSSAAQPKEMSSRGSQWSKGQASGHPGFRNGEQSEARIKGKPGRGHITLPWTISQGREGCPKGILFSLRLIPPSSSKAGRGGPQALLQHFSQRNHSSLLPNTAKSSPSIHIRELQAEGYRTQNSVALNLA